MDFFEVVHSQRSIRQYKPDPVPDEMIWQIIEAATRAPSGSNLQPWIWWVIKDERMRQIISKAVSARMASTEAREQRLRDVEAMADTSRRTMMVKATKFIEDIAVAPVFIIPCLVGVTSPVSDPRSLLAGSSIYGAVQNLMLAARALGLGTVLTTFNSFMESTLHEELQLPPDVVPTSIIPVGYPDGQKFGPTTRKPVETVTYWDEWGSVLPR